MQREKTKIVIIDDNASFRSMLCEYLSNLDEFKVIASVDNGLDGVQVIIDKKPDVVLIDIVMPKLDGLGVMERINKSDLVHKPQFIVLSAMGQEKTIKLANYFGADYFIVKPFNMDDLVSRIRQIKFMKQSSATSYHKTEPQCNQPECSIENKINRLFNDLGMPANLKGYEYLKEAIKMVLDDISSINSIYKSIYANIALTFNTTPARVERAIRNAIEATWDRGNHNLINSIFESKVKCFYMRPANSDFIIMVVDYIKKSIHI